MSALVAGRRDQPGRVRGSGPDRPARDVAADYAVLAVPLSTHRGDRPLTGARPRRPGRGGVDPVRGGDQVDPPVPGAPLGSTGLQRRVLHRPAFGRHLGRDRRAGRRRRHPDRIRGGAARRRRPRSSTSPIASSRRSGTSTRSSPAPPRSSRPGQRRLVGRALLARVLRRAGPGAGAWRSPRRPGSRSGRIHFAGDHTDRQFPGYMEGAVRSGKRGQQMRPVLAAGARGTRPR